MRRHLAVGWAPARLLRLHACIDSPLTCLIMCVSKPAVFRKRWPHVFDLSAAVRTKPAARGCGTGATRHDTGIIACTACSVSTWSHVLIARLEQSCCETTEYAPVEVPAARAARQGFGPASRHIKAFASAVRRSLIIQLVQHEQQWEQTKVGKNTIISCAKPRRTFRLGRVNIRSRKVGHCPCCHDCDRGRPSAVELAWTVRYKWSCVAARKLCLH